MSKDYILALDQGTTSSRAILVDKQGRIAGMAQQELTQHYPHPGWVEHDPEEIWASQLSTALEVLTVNQVSPKNVAAIGITNQRETTIVWDKYTGKPVARAIVWQCRRSAPYCDQLKVKGMSSYIKKTTGLVVDAYFSGTKVKWYLDNIPNARVRAEKGDLLFGTVDSWLIWNLTKGKLHITDYTNAARTMIYNIRELTWDSELVSEFAIPYSMLPEVRNSSEIYGYTDASIFDGTPIPIAGIAGDQHAALFGQACSEQGMAKNTYGTGCFILMNTGTTFVESDSNLLTTIAWGVDNKVEYALEGSVFTAGAAVGWLRDGLGLIESAAESEELAREVEDTDGVYIVPAFTGLGAPHWDMYARGIIGGLTNRTRKAHIVRAVLESIAYQTKDVINAMERDSGIKLQELRVDGGASANNLLLQFQADILGTVVKRAQIIETSALGAAHLAGLAVGFWHKQDIINNRKAIQEFVPKMEEGERKRLYSGWKKAVKCTLQWDK